VKQGGVNSDRNTIFKSVEREAQTVAETAKMRVRVQHQCNPAAYKDGWVCAGATVDRVVAFVIPACAVYVVQGVWCGAVFDLVWWNRM
jgi:hypothetical protein